MALIEGVTGGPIEIPTINEVKNMDEHDIDYVVGELHLLKEALDKLISYILDHE